MNIKRFWIIVLCSITSFFSKAICQDVEQESYQVPCNRPEFILCDTARWFNVANYQGSFFCRILILKSGKVVDFDIFKLRVKTNKYNDFCYKKTGDKFKRFEDYPDTVKLLFPAIEDLIYNRLYIQIKDTNAIMTDTIFVIWGRSIGTE